MARELRRRGVLRGLAVAGATGVAGCNFGDSATGGDGGTGSGTATREPLTWAEATREVLDQSDVEALRGTLSEVESTLTRLDSLIGRMKSTTVPLTGVSVWEAATSLSPSLQGFDAALDRTLDEVRTWLSLLADVTGSLGDVRETIEAVRGGQIEQAVRLAEQTERGLSAVGDLESRSSSLRETLSESARVTGQVADVSGQLGRMAGEVGDIARMTAQNTSDDGGSYLDHLVVTSG